MSLPTVKQIAYVYNQCFLQRPQKLIPSAEHFRVITICPRLLIWEVHCVPLGLCTETPQASHTTWLRKCAPSLSYDPSLSRVWAMGINEEVEREVWNCTHLETSLVLSTRHRFPVGNTSCSKLLLSVSYDTGPASVSVTLFSERQIRFMLTFLRVWLEHVEPGVDLWGCSSRWGCV
jgi:hypothetical protein